MSSQRIAYILYDADLTINDPGNGNILVVDRSPCCWEIEASGAETRTLSAPRSSGVLLYVSLRSGTCTVTGAESTLDLWDTSQLYTLVSTQNESGSYVWRIASGDTEFLANRKNGQDSVTYAATLAIDFDDGEADNKLITLTGNLELTALTAVRPGRYLILLVQDTAGGWIVTWPASMVPAGNHPQPEPTINSTTVFELWFDGNDFFFM